MPRRAEIFAATKAAATLAGLLFAPLTLVLAVACHVVSRVSRWRPVWLTAPVACGAVWALAVGPGAALAGFGAGPTAVTALLSRVAGAPARLGLLASVPGVVTRAITSQFPLALILAPALAAVAWWLKWLHSDEWDVSLRPGLVAACRRCWHTARVRAGGVVTREGACLGVDQATGGPAALSWREAEGGVLVTGAEWAQASQSSLRLVHAAIRRRMPVIVVDLTGDAGLLHTLAAMCAEAGAPLQVFGPDGGGCYEPVGEAGPEDAADLVMGVIDWGQTPESARLTARALLAEALATANAPGESSQPGHWPAGGAVLDRVVELLCPGGGRAAMRRMPGYPDRAGLAEHTLAASRWEEPGQATAGRLAEQLAALRGSELGRWLAPAPPGARPAAGVRISLADVVRQRAVAVFSLDRAKHGHSASVIANMVALDATAVYARLGRLGAMSDGAIWFGSCDTVDARALAGLLAVSARGRGPARAPAPAPTFARAGGLRRACAPGGASAGAGLACVLTTTSPEVAGRLAGQVSSRVAHRLDDPQLAGRLAPFTGSRFVPGAQVPPGGLLWRPGASMSHCGPVAGAGEGGREHPFGVLRRPLMPAESFCALGDGEFILTARGRAGARGRAVAARIPGVAGGRAR